jgi:large subunit ribosomal protein L15
MLLHEISSKNKNKAPRVGRGGKRGTTAGRGQKGQTAHAGRGIRPADRDYIQRLPKLRGRGTHQNKPHAPKLPVINIGDLDLTKKIPAGYKILGGGEITKSVRIYGPVSKSARAKIEKAGGFAK